MEYLKYLYFLLVLVIMFLLKNEIEGKGVSEKEKIFITPI